MIRKEKAYIWVMLEVSKREEELVIRLCLGKQINSFIYSIVFIQHFTFKTPE